MEDPQEKQEEWNSRTNNESSRNNNESSRSSVSIMSTSTISDEDIVESRRIMDGTPGGNGILRRSTRQINPHPRYNYYALMCNIMNTSEPIN